MRLILRPETLGTKGRRYAVLLGGRELCRSRIPFYDAARVLLAEGTPPETVLGAQHEGSAIVAMRSTVGEAARWTIMENSRGQLRRIPWMPYAGPEARDGKADSAHAGVPENGREGAGQGVRAGQGLASPGGASRTP